MDRGFEEPSQPVHRISQALQWRSFGLKRDLLTGISIAKEREGKVDYALKAIDRGIHITVYIKILLTTPCLNAFDLVAGLKKVIVTVNALDKRGKTNAPPCLLSVP